MQKIYLFPFTFYYLSYLLHSKMFLPIKNTIWTTSVVYILVAADSVYTYTIWKNWKLWLKPMFMLDKKLCWNALLLPSFTFCEEDAVTITIVFMKFPGLVSDMQDMHHFLSGKASSKLLFFVDKIIFKLVSCFQVFLLNFKT